MRRTMFNRIRMIQPAPDRTSWGRSGSLDGEARYRSSAGHGSRMPSQATSTRFQRPY